MKRPLPLDPGFEHVSPSVKGALQAWGKGQMTQSQQLDLLAFILNDVCAVMAIDPPDLTERQSGFTAGSRRVGIVIAKLTGARFAVPSHIED